MAKTKSGSGLYDAFPTKKGAQGAVKGLAFHYGARCKASVRKLNPPQDGGRLKYGVYVAKSCKILWGGR